MIRLFIAVALVMMSACGAEDVTSFPSSTAGATPSREQTPTPSATPPPTCDPGPVFSFEEMEPPQWAIEPTPSPGDVILY